MTLRMLKTVMPMLRTSLKYIEHGAPERTTKRVDGSTLVSLRKRIFRRSGGLCECPVCQAGYPIAITMTTFELDHVVPLYQGGTNAIANLRALHRQCHARITAEQAAERAVMRRSWTDGIE